MGEEGEEGFAPTLKKIEITINAAFDRIVAEARAEGLGANVIREFEIERQRTLALVG